MNSFDLIGSLVVLILIRNSDGLFVASEKEGDGVRAINCAPSNLEQIVECLTNKGYPLIDIYDALYVADKDVRKEVDARLPEMNEVVQKTRYLKIFSEDED